MKPITVGIIDDEKDGRDFVSLLVQNEFPELSIELAADNVEDALIRLSKKWPDILFLDIQLKDGNAFDILARFNKIPSRIIFVTAYEQYAIQALKKGATDYLLKPIKRVDFVLAVNKALESIAENRPPEIPEKANPIRTQAADMINLPTMQGFRRVSIADIIRCEANSNYTLIYLADHSKVLVSRTLQEFEESFATNGFFRIHHKHLINLSHLKEYIKGKGGQVIMQDNSVIDVSVRRKNEFIQALSTPPR